MLHKLIIIYSFTVLTFANMHFEKNKQCSSCHPEIYAEYQTSQHRNSTIFQDPIHKAVYNEHPQKNKKEKYRCGKCHTPAADNLKALVTPHNGIIPDINNETQDEAVACAYCHRITDTIAGKAMNKNIISSEPRKYFANLTSHIKSPFHKIETNKEIFKNGKLCMGCHMHKTNNQNFDVCSTENDNMDGQNNCITCHMPKVDGAPSVMSSKSNNRHAFHGFPGIHGDISKLSKYVKLNIFTANDKTIFAVEIDHQATHSSSLHPLRMAKLKVSIKRGNKVIKLETKKIFKVIGDKGKGTPPWLATTVIKNSTISANSRRVYAYKINFQSGDIITAIFGYHLMMPKILKRFGLENNQEAKKFRLMSSKTVIIK